MPRQVDHGTRRADISEAVLAIAAERGFRDVTIRAVAAHVGASTSTVTHYVSGRDELIGMAVHREVQAHKARVAEEVAHRDARAALRAVVEWSVLGASEDAHRRWLAIVVGARSEPVVRTQLDAFNHWWDALLHRLARELDPPHADPDTVVDALDVIVNGLVLAGLEGREPWSMARRMRVVEAVLAPLGI